MPPVDRFAVTHGIVAFLAWTIYFDQNDYFTLQQRQKELDGLNDDITYLNTEIDRMNAEKHDLVTNPRVIEKYAREHFRMKHDGEDVYVIDPGAGTATTK